ncbi:hypothetical protein JL720_2449 [Aureococcus anophagefferens]|nr:hypothetical protein JL720_2449 [Aureococcus anophagefferens]
MLSFAPKESPDVLRRLRSAAQRVLADEHGLGDAVATVASIPCREPGCPPFETFVQILSDVLPVAFRLNKRPADVSDAELASRSPAVAGARLAPGDADAPPPPPLPPAPHAFKRTPDATIGIAALRGVVREVVDATDTIDVHTHLFPPSHGDLCAYGIDALLTYHYLADLVWDGLFVRRTPLSEACVGVLTTLAAFPELRPALDPPLTAASLVPIRAFFDAADPAEHATRVLAMAGVKYVVCTNVPFDAREASEFVDETCCVDFRAALRVALLKGDWATIAASLAQRGLPETLAGARTFLKAWAKRYGAVYLMASSPADFAYPRDEPKQPGWPSATALVDDVLVPVARELRLPLALKLGARRGMNPDLDPCGGGDGVVVADGGPLVDLCSRNPDVKFLATFLSRVNQHEAAVMSQKFRNLHVYGCWWYCNNPSIIGEITRMRLELLGTAFTAQHSDCRVLEQLIYKWAHSRRVVADALADQYEHLVRTGFTLSHAAVERDVEALLGGAYEAFLAK